jgi:hypothetical protein
MLVACNQQQRQQQARRQQEHKQSWRRLQLQLTAELTAELKAVLTAVLINQTSASNSRHRPLLCCIAVFASNIYPSSTSLHSRADAHKPTQQG